MKKVIPLFLIIIISVLLSNCEDSISPKGDLPDKYSTNLILRGDTTTQIAYVAKLYNVEGNDPYSSKNDPAISDAIVSLKYSNSTELYYLNDTTDNQNINERYNSPAKYYYIDNFAPQNSKTVELTVQLPNGEELSSVTTIPNQVLFDDFKTLRFYPGPLIGRDTVNYRITLHEDITEPDLIKAYKITISYYYREDDGTTIKKFQPVPLDGDGRTVMFSFSSDNLFNRNTLEETLRNISEGDTKKGRYTITPLKVEVFTFDENLTKYFQSNLYFNLGLTLQNNPSDLSNITNGYGYFASYSYGIRYLKFDPQFLLDEFGYLSGE